LHGVSTTETDGGNPRGPITRRRLGLAITAAVIVFAAVGAAVWLLQSNDSTESTSSGAPSGVSARPRTGPATARGMPATVVSPSKLRNLAAASGRPLYWAGARAGTRLEYTQTSDGTTYVRYLTGSAKAGDPRARYLVVATYAQPDAFRRVSVIAGQQHLFVASLANGGIAVTRPGRPENVYVVYPKQPYQVEVYSPRATETRRLVVSGAIQPIR
jgi:hypothetical protein